MYIECSATSIRKGHTNNLPIVDDLALLAVLNYFCTSYMLSALSMINLSIQSGIFYVVQKIVNKSECITEQYL